MKTFQQFCGDAYQLNEFRIQNTKNNPVVRNISGVAKNLIRGLNVMDVIDRTKSPLEKAGAAYGVVKPYSPVTYAPTVFNQGKTGSLVDKTAKAIPGMTPNLKTDIGRRLGTSISRSIVPSTASGKVPVKGSDGKTYYMDK